MSKRRGGPVTAKPIRELHHTILKWSRHYLHLWKNHATVSMEELKMGDRSSAKERIRDALKESEIPMDVENVRVKAGLKNWESTKAILLEMVLQGSVLGQKTTKSWIFWVNTPIALFQQSKRGRKGAI